MKQLAKTRATEEEVSELKLKGSCGLCLSWLIDPYARDQARREVLAKMEASRRSWDQSWVTYLLAFSLMAFTAKLHTAKNPLPETPLELLLSIPYHRLLYGVCAQPAGSTQASWLGALGSFFLDSFVPDNALCYVKRTLGLLVNALCFSLLHWVLGQLGYASVRFMNRTACHCQPYCVLPRPLRHSHVQGSASSSLFDPGPVSGALVLPVGDLARSVSPPLASDAPCPAASPDGAPVLRSAVALSLVLVYTAASRVTVPCILLGACFPERLGSPGLVYFSIPNVQTL
jgi:hypothetical protein